MSEFVFSSPFKLGSFYFISLLYKYLFYTKNDDLLYQEHKEKNLTITSVEFYRSGKKVSKHHTWKRHQSFWLIGKAVANHSGLLLLSEP